MTHVGKESNLLEEVEAGLEHDPDEVWTECADRQRDPWSSLVLPLLKQIPAKQLADATGRSKRSIKAIRNERRRPRDQHRAALVRAARDFTRYHLEGPGHAAPHDDLAAGAAHDGR